MKLTQGNLSPLEFSPTQDPGGGWPIVFWSMDGQSLSSHLTHSSLAHGNVYHLCENYKQNAYIYIHIYICDVKLGFCTQFLLLRHNIETDLIYFCNILRPRQNGRHFPDDIFKCIFLNENQSVAIKTGVCCWGSNLQYSSIISDNGLAPSKQQAIIWNDDG